MKRLIGAIVRKVISKKAYRILRFFPLMVPSYYKNYINYIEEMIDIQQRDKDTEDVAVLFLRKNAHILDKGLQRKDFEQGHGQENYKKAVHFLSKISSPQLLEDHSVKWSIGKIKEYEARQMDESIDVNLEQEDFRGNYDDILRLMKSRRSSRNYLSKKVEESELIKVMEAINWASSSCNKQPIKIFATIKPELIKKCLSQCKGATGFGDHVPAFMTCCADMRGYVLPSEMLLPMIDSSLGMQNAVLAAHTLGLSTTLLSWAQKDEEEERLLRELLGIPAHYAIIFNLAMGYPSIIAPTPKRKSINSTLVIR
ncbi:MAG: hypothetical protein COA79_15760 [Planctomycetota bacterium]|nr:MAG: hypothetical protein COA79_15760 [Planctomycetota bacterium]